MSWRGPGKLAWLQCSEGGDRPKREVGGPEGWLFRGSGWQESVDGFSPRAGISEGLLGCCRVGPRAEVDPEPIFLHILPPGGPGCGVSPGVSPDPSPDSYLSLCSHSRLPRVWFLLNHQITPLTPHLNTLGASVPFREKSKPSQSCQDRHDLCSPRAPGTSP